MMFACAKGQKLITRLIIGSFATGAGILAVLGHSLAIAGVLLVVATICLWPFLMARSRAIIALVAEMKGKK